ncbi:hypothetical protein GOV13_00785 [Candidatus Pacearchaeota archaeon]|nr:hypothetical protein [Candidatus Pacearchaeota archaeon]
MNKLDWFETKKATTSFALVALAGGFIFLNRGITGNVILDSKYSFNMLSIIGLLLIVCAVVLGAHTIWKK